MGRYVAAALAVGGLFGLAAVAGFAGTGDGGGAPAPASFRLEDGSAGCTYRESGEIACRAAGAEAAVVLDPSGASRADSGALVTWDESSPVLLVSESWWNGAVSCRVVDSRIVCATNGGSIASGGPAG